MRPRADRRGNGDSLGAIPSLLQSSAELLGIRFELLLPGRPSIAAQPPGWKPGALGEILAFPVSRPGMPDGRLLALFGPNGEAAGSRAPERPVAFLENLARLLAEQDALSRQVEELAGELEHRSGELDLLHAISGRVGGEEDVRRAIRSILWQARETVDADAAFVALEGRRLCESAVGAGIGGEMRSGGRLWRKLGGAVSLRLMNAPGRAFIGSIEDLGLGPNGIGREARVIAVAIRPRQGIEGALGLVRLHPGNHRAAEVRLLESLSGKIAAVLADVELYDDLRDFLMATVKSLVSAIDAKDPYTSGHSERVNILSMLLGKTMGLDPDEMEILRWASLLHDVGKIGMPEEILKKPGALTPEEFEIVKEHPDRGYKMLDPIRQLSAASLGVRCHHERYDGTGYPLGLGGAEIPLAARIISVADTYDALTTHRSYRPGREPEGAFEVIRKVRGSQLDPVVVDRLGELMPFLREHRVMIQPEIAEIPEAGDGDRRAA